MIQQKPIMHKNNNLELALGSTLAIISRMDIEKNKDSHEIFLLLNSIRVFIKKIPNVFNEELSIYGILNVLNKNLENIYNNNLDVLEQHYKSNTNDEFSSVYNAFETYFKLNSKKEKIEIYCNAIEKINAFILIGEQYEE